MSRVLLSMFAALLLLAPATVHADRIEAHGYVATGGDATVACESATGLNLGGACSVLAGGESSVTIEIADERFQAVGGYHLFENAAGEAIQEAAFCGETSVPVPPDAVLLFVFVSQALSQLDCGTATPGTLGTVTFRYE